MHILNKLVFILLISFTGISQNMEGEYEVIHDTANSYISYNLDLSPNGRFEFHFYRKNDCDLCVEENKYGQGAWKTDGKKLTLTVDPSSDLDKKFTLNLNNSKAHYISKSPRDKSDKVVKTRLKFYESEVPWVKGMELFKQ